MLFLDRRRILDQFNLRDDFALADSLLLSVLERLVRLTQLRVVQNVLRVLAPLAGVDWQFTQHDLLKKWFFVSLEAQTHDLVVDAGEDAAGRCVNHLLGDFAQGLVALHNDLEEQARDNIRAEVRNHMVEQFSNHTLDQNDTVKHDCNVECDQEVVRDLHINLLSLNLELFDLSSLLNISLQNLAHLSENDERLCNLFGFNSGNEVQVSTVESDGHHGVNASVQVRVFEFVLGDEGSAHVLRGALSDLVVAQFESDLGEIAINLVQTQWGDSQDFLARFADAVHANALRVVAAHSEHVALVRDQACDLDDVARGQLAASAFVISVVQAHVDAGGLKLAVDSDLGDVAPVLVLSDGLVEGQLQSDRRARACNHHGEGRHWRLLHVD